MVDWCLFSEGLDKNGVIYPMCPDIVIVNVPDRTALNIRKLIRFLKKQIPDQDLKWITIKTTLRQYWRLTSIFGGCIVKILTDLGFLRKFYRENYTLVSLANEIPYNLKQGFMVFGIEYLIGFYDWTGASDKNQMKRDFAIRHPDLAGNY